MPDTPTSIRALHVAADAARNRHDDGSQTEVWDGWTEFYDAGKPLRTAVLRYADLLSTRNYDALIAAALAAHATDTPIPDWYMAIKNMLFVIDGDSRVWEMIPRKVMDDLRAAVAVTLEATS